jgi:uncharacterized metal-binding protein
MADTPTCACGGNEPVRVILPCAGQANTGQLTNLAAIQLTEEGFGNIACIALLAIGAEGLKKTIAEAEEVVILDGCPVQCASKIATAKGVNSDQQIVVTDLGIKKSYSRAYSEADVETVVSAIWQGIGRRSDDKKDPSSKEKGNGCGCGCGGRC